MKRKIIINYHWNCNQKKDIPEKHKEALEEDALERIYEMLCDKFSSGELHTSVRYGKDVVPEEDEEEGLTYTGRYDITYYNEKNYNYIIVCKKCGSTNVCKEEFVNLNTNIISSDIESVSDLCWCEDCNDETTILIKKLK